MPPTAGLYALILPSIVYAMVASTRQVMASPDAAAAALKILAAMKTPFLIGVF